MSSIRNSRIIPLVLALAVAFMMSACGMDHSPMAASDDADQSTLDTAPAPAAKKPASSETEESGTDSKKGDKVTKVKGPARFSLGG